MLSAQQGGCSDAHSEQSGDHGEAAPRHFAFISTTDDQFLYSRRAQPFFEHCTQIDAALVETGLGECSLCLARIDRTSARILVQQ